MPYGEVPVQLAEAIMWSIAKLSSVHRLCAQIFFLSAAYGITTGDVAILLGLKDRDVRRAMLKAIACLDGKGG